jgi:hypothetical protein
MNLTATSQLPPQDSRTTSVPQLHLQTNVSDLGTERAVS